MTEHLLTLKLPESLFEPMSEIANATDQSLEDVVIKRLRSVLTVEMPSLPTDEESELAALKFLSDDTLFAIMGEQMSRRDQERLQRLMDDNTRGALSDVDHAELIERGERSERLILRKAWAAGILIERGHKIGLDDFTHPPE